jgi:hypothetical protein
MQAPGSRGVWLLFNLYLATKWLHARPRFTPGTHWIGGWVDFRASLDTEARRKSFASAGDRVQVVQSVVRQYTD